MAKSIEASRKAALAYIAERNHDGQFDATLYALAEGRIDIGLLEYSGDTPEQYARMIREIDKKLAAPPAERLDYRIDLLKAERIKLAEAIQVVEHFIANPILYTLKVS